MSCPRALRAAALALLWVACSSPEERLARHVARAEAFLREERSSDAILELQNALKLDPERADVNRRLGELYAASNAASLATFHLSEAYRLEPRNLEVALRLIELLQRSDPPRAERIVRREKQAHPDDPRVHRSESAFALANGDLARAVAAALEATRTGAEDPANWAQLGAAQRATASEALHRGNSAEPALAAALAAFDAVLARAPGDLRALLEIARVHASWPGHQSDAIAAFRTALEQAARTGDAQARRAAALGLERFARGQGDLALEREALREQLAISTRSLATWERLAAVTERLEGAEAARTVYRELVAAWPESPAAHIARSAFDARNGRAAEAIDALRGALARVDEPSLYEQLVRLQILDGRVADARASGAELVARHPEDPVTHRTRARLALAEGRAQEAYDLVGALGSAGETAESEALRARVQLALGRVDEARASVERALRLAPASSVPALRLEAAVRARTEDWKQALDALEGLRERGVAPSGRERLIESRALYASGDREQAREKLAELLEDPEAPPEAAVEFARREGGADPSAALAHLGRALQRSPDDFEVLQELTRLESSSGRGAQALARLEGRIEAGSVAPRLLLLRAEVLARTGQLARAEADALRAFEAAPDLPGAVDLLYELYRAQGRLELARRSFEEAEAAGVLHAGARVLLARLQLSQGEPDHALATLERVVAQSPDLARAKNDLAFLLAWRGDDLERAARLADEALSALPGSANAEDTAGYVQLRRGQPEPALAHFGRAIAHASPGDPSLPTFFYHRGIALSELERGAEASDAFETALELDPSFASAADARARLDRMH